jgi:hypothetical protein
MPSIRIYPCGGQGSTTGKAGALRASVTGAGIALPILLKGLDPAPPGCTRLGTTLSASAGRAAQFARTVAWDATRFKAGGKARPGVWKCKACRKQLTVTVNTIFERSHIELRLWLMAFVCV